MDVTHEDIGTDDLDDEENAKEEVALTTNQENLEGLKG